MTHRGGLMVTLPEVLTIVQCTRDDFNNWHRRGILSTKFPKATAGIPRVVTRENALELAFLAALVKCGIEPLAASHEVQRWLYAERRSRVSRYWATNPRGNVLHLPEPVIR